METVLAKGPNFVYAREYTQTQHGFPDWETVLSSLPSETAVVWREADIESAYSFTLFKEGVAVIAQVVGLPRRLETAHIYTYIAERSLRTIFQTYFQLAQPDTVLQNFPMLWEHFFTAGRVTVIPLRDRQVQINFIVPDIFLDWLPAACLGYSQGAVALAGGEHLSMHALDREYLADEEMWLISYKLGWI